MRYFFPYTLCITKIVFISSGENPLPTSSYLFMKCVSPMFWHFPAVPARKIYGARELCSICCKSIYGRYFIRERVLYGFPETYPGWRDISFFYPGTEFHEDEGGK